MDTRKLEKPDRDQIQSILDEYVSHLTEEPKNLAKKVAIQLLNEKINEYKNEKSEEIIASAAIQEMQLALNKIKKIPTRTPDSFKAFTDKNIVENFKEAKILSDELVKLFNQKIESYNKSDNAIILLGEKFRSVEMITDRLKNTNITVSDFKSIVDKQAPTLMSQRGDNWFAKKLNAIFTKLGFGPIFVTGTGVAKNIHSYFKEKDKEQKKEPMQNIQKNKPNP